MFKKCFRLQKQNYSNLKKVNFLKNLNLCLIDVIPYKWFINLID